MQVKRLLIAAIVLMVAVPAFAQFEANTMGSGGVFFDRTGHSHFALFVGAESDFGLVVDTNRGYDLVLRSGYFHVRGDSQIQAVNGFLIAKKSLGLLNKIDWYVALGGGGTIQLKDGPDLSSSGLKFETGVSIFGKLSVLAGLDYYPVESGKDPMSVYLGFDFAKRVVKSK